jgi:hypothetical protein
VAAFVLVATTALFLGGWLATLRLANSRAISLAANIAQTRNEATATIEVSVTGIPTKPLEEIDYSSLEAELLDDTPPAQTPLAPLAAPTSTAEPLPALPAPTFTPVTVAEVTPTPTTSPTPLPPTATPTATPVPPTATPAPTAIVRMPTTGPRTPAPAGAKIGPIQFATGVTADVKAINPGELFPADVEAIYAIYSYSGMKNGLPFVAVWYQNGVELWRDESTWQWGGSARSFSYLKPPGQGLYKLELYINDTVMATGLFEIR